MSKLRFLLTRYDLEGNFYGFFEMDGDLSICRLASDDQSDIYRIGVDLKYSCTIDLKKLISNKEFERPRIQNYFFEMYLKDYNDDLIDVPILIENLQSQGGGYPNQED